MSNPIPFLDLSAQYRTIKEEVDAAIMGVLDSQAFVLGEALSKFEAEFARFSKSKHAIGVGNGTDAIFLGLKALGVGAGDEVIVPANSFIATSGAVASAGAKIRFCDVCPDTALLDIAQMESLVTAKTKVVIPVHLYGQVCDVKQIRDCLAALNRTDIKILEDAAQAHGARFEESLPGEWGDLATFSFYPGKNLGAYGDGGAIITKNDAIAAYLFKARDHGREEKYCHSMEGINSRLDAIQASVLSVKLNYLSDWLDKRNTHGSYYNHAFSESAAIQAIQTQKMAYHTYHLYVVRCRDRSRLQRRLDVAGIGFGIHYPVPLHLQPAHRYLGYQKGAFPVTEALAESIISLPMYPELCVAQLDRVIDVVLGG